jgi:formylglycine-generating enzyme required for sulfatase activity
LDTGNFPVECVSWEEAVAFCEKLSDMAEEKREKRLYSLPAEAQWEFACRGGAPSSSPFHLGASLSSTQANFDGNHPYGGAAKGPYLERPTPVGSYRPNAFGLFDMHGNVWEWCADWFAEDYYAHSPGKDPTGPPTGTSRVLRGGSWNNGGQLCRAAYRFGREPGFRFYSIGVRVVLLPA